MKTEKEIIETQRDCDKIEVHRDIMRSVLYENESKMHVEQNLQRQKTDC
jgi:hypothetical protein